jgi:ABC-2 type transport system ATP-binding protein
MTQATQPRIGTDPVRLRGLTKRYGQVTAVDNLDLTIEAGEVVALLGPNGAGKSTTIDMMLGLTRPDRGTATVYGLAPAAAIAAGRVGALLQSGGLLPDLTVGEIVKLSAALHRPASSAQTTLQHAPTALHRPASSAQTTLRQAPAVPHRPAAPAQTTLRQAPAAQHRRPRPVTEVLARAGIADLTKRKIGTLSGGQQQRVRFAIALVADPDLIVLDEPTTGLDVEARRAFWTSMREETGQGRTVLFATHYLEEADAYADRIVLMRAGRVVADGTASEIKAAVTGRTIRATLPDADLSRLAALPGVDKVESRGDAVLLHCADSDPALRSLLTQTPARDIEVVARGLEDAFIALTTGSTS